MDLRKSGKMKDQSAGRPALGAVGVGVLFGALCVVALTVHPALAQKHLPLVAGSQQKAAEWHQLEARWKKLGSLGFQPVDSLRERGRAAEWNKLHQDMLAWGHLAEVHTVQIRFPENGYAHLRSVKDGAAEVGVAKIRVAQVGAPEDGLAQVTAEELNAAHLSLCEIRTCQGGVGQVRAGQVGSRKVGVRRVRTRPGRPQRRTFPRSMATDFTA